MVMNSPFRTSKFFFFSNHMPGSGNFLRFTYINRSASSDYIYYLLLHSLIIFQAPQPIDKKVTIVEKPPMVVYVRQFNGYPHSYQNWEVEYKNLKKDLLGDSSDNDNINADLDVWYHIGYDSPWIPADQRRNEIWIPYTESVETNTI